MRKIIFGLLLLNFQIAYAQSAGWMEGSLVTANDEVLVGNIILEDKYDLVLFQQEGSRMVYPAHQIKSIYFYDNHTNINRRFVSLTNVNEIRKEHLLYEIVVSGEITVLRRKKQSAFSDHSDPLDYNYFTRYKNILSPLAKFNRTILPLLVANTDGRMAQFISENGLRRYDTASSIRIIEFHNAKIPADNFQPTAFNSERSTTFGPQQEP